MLLTPSPCHKLSHLLGPPPPSVTYFMDGPYTNTRKFSVKVVGPTVWHNLLADITNVPLLHLFRKRLHAYVLTLSN